MDHAATYDLIASVLIYPDETFEERLATCEASLGALDDEARDRFVEWAQQMRDLSAEDRQEVYTRTFDLSPKCTLELGWHLFGEQYDRGTFLVWMRGQLRGFSLEETTDLPDHVRHVLPVLGRLEPSAADKFSRACVLPAMETIRDGLKTMDSPYGLLINGVCSWLESRHGASDRDATDLPILSEDHEALLRAESV